MSSGGENNMHTLLADFFDNSELDAETSYLGAASPDNIFSILEALESSEFDPLTSLAHETSHLDPKEGEAEAEGAKRLVSQKSSSSLSSSAPLEESKTELEAAAAAANDSSPKAKRQKLSTGAAGEEDDGQQKISHITVERNRRKQMNDNLVVLRSLMPSFYVKRGDQASIVGGVVDYISELQLVLQSLEAKKQRKVYSEVLSPRFVVSSPRLTSSPLSPRKPPLSPRLVPTSSSLPISPRTPTPTSPYKHHRLHQLSPTMPATAAAASSLEPSPSSSPSIDHTSCGNELVANSKSAIADVVVKFSGPNVLLKTTSPRIPGQAVKIISALEEHLSLEILNVSVNTIDQTMLNSFTIKIGIECQLSAEELAHQIQQTFC